MAAMDFPNAPTIGQKYLQYTWDGEKWIVQGVGGGGGGGSAVYTSDTPPASAPDNSLWVETDTGMMFVRWNDSNSSQWVAIPGGIADAVRYATAQSLTSAQMSQARANINVTKRNYIINGGMQISQETTLSVWVSATPIYAVDMFSAHSSYATSLGAQQIAVPTPAGSSHRLQLNVGTADATMDAGDIVQIIFSVEGLRAADLQLGTAAAKTFTLQFGVRAPAGTYGVSFHNNANDRHYVTSFTVASGEANTDVVKSITVAGDVTGTWLKDNNRGLDIRIFLVGGSAYQTATTNSWFAGAALYCPPTQFNFMGTIGSNFHLFDVSLTEGAVAPPFQVPDYTSELALCQRYYRLMQNTTIGFYAAGASQTMYLCLPFNEMRGAPTLTVKAAPSNTNCTISTATGPSVRDMRLDITPAANGACFSIGGIYALNARV